MIYLLVFHREIHNSTRRALKPIEPCNVMMKKLLCGILAALTDYGV